MRRIVTGVDDHGRSCITSIDAFEHYTGRAGDATAPVDRRRPVGDGWPAAAVDGGVEPHEPVAAREEPGG
jgi:hypothetical protein